MTDGIVHHDSIVHYESEEADSSRWAGFEMRAGDVIISSPPKSGTTWTQLLVALLVFDGPNFPSSLGRMSPWLDLKVQPADDTYALLKAQDHRRFIKTHTPLDGLPARSDVRYVCVGRDPRDAAVSMVHHKDNLDRARLGELNGAALPEPPDWTVEEHLEHFIEGAEVPGWNLAFVAHHYVTFWARKGEPNVALFHFSDYLANLSEELARLAHHLEIPLTTRRARELAEHAHLDITRKNAARFAPDAHLGVWKDAARFFRSGSQGEGHRTMSAAQQKRYATRVAELMPEELIQWAHEGRFPPCT